MTTTTPGSRTSSPKRRVARPRRKPKNAQVDQRKTQPSAQTSTFASGKSAQADGDFDLEATVAQINELARKGLQSDLAIGQLVFDAVFDGDRANVSTKGKNTSWRKLAERTDLQMSHSRVWYAVRLHLQHEDLRQGGFNKKLKVSHLRRLVSVRSLKVKLRLANKAVDRKWTVKQLEAEIAKVTKNGKKLPDHIRALQKLARLVEPMTEQVVTVEDVDRVGGPERMREMRVSLESQINTLSAALEKIDTALAEYPAGEQVA